MIDRKEGFLQAEVCICSNSESYVYFSSYYIIEDLLVISFILF